MFELHERHSCIQRIVKYVGTLALGRVGTIYSSIVETSPTGSPMSQARRTRRMILPEQLFVAILPQISPNVFMVTNKVAHEGITVGFHHDAKTNVQA